MMMCAFLQLQTIFSSSINLNRASLLPNKRKVKVLTETWIAQNWMSNYLSHSQNIIFESRISTIRTSAIRKRDKGVFENTTLVVEFDLGKSAYRLDPTDDYLVFVSNCYQHEHIHRTGKSMSCEIKQYTWNTIIEDISKFTESHSSFPLLLWSPTIETQGKT